MNIVRLNTVSLDGIIKKGGSSGGGNSGGGGAMEYWALPEGWMSGNEELFDLIRLIAMTCKFKMTEYVTYIASGAAMALWGVEYVVAFSFAPDEKISLEEPISIRDLMASMNTSLTDFGLTPMTEEEYYTI